MNHYFGSEELLMKNLCCISCGKTLIPPFRNPGIKYCNAHICQRVRKSLWQQQKLASDPDYKANQYDAQKQWREANSDYSREYRQKNTAYAENNRVRQGERNQKRRVHLQNQAADQIAKMDALSLVDALNTGNFKLVPVSEEKIAKMDALIIKLTVIT